MTRILSTLAIYLGIRSGFIASFGGTGNDKLFRNTNRRIHSELFFIRRTKHHGEMQQTQRKGLDTHTRIVNIKSPRQYLDFIKEDERLCIVKFYASWCKSCRRFDSRFRKLTHVIADQEDTKGNIVESGSVRVAQVEIHDNAKLCNKLGISKLGCGGLVSDFVCGPKDFHVLVDQVSNFLNTTVDLEQHLDEDYKI